MVYPIISNKLPMFDGEYQAYQTISDVIGDGLLLGLPHYLFSVY